MARRNPKTALHHRDNPHGGAYRGSPIPGHDTDVVEKRFKRAGERRAEKERQRQLAKERYERDAARVEAERARQKAQMEAKMAREVRWNRIDEWHRFLDEGHAALDFGDADPALRGFFDHHYRTRRPVLFAAGHFEPVPLMAITPQLLAHQWGNVPVEVQVNRDDPSRYEIEGASHKAMMPFQDFLLKALPYRPNNAYMTANNTAANRELMQCMRPYLEPLPGVLTGDPTQGFLWIGRGSFTPIHHDLTNNLMFQLVGTKIVRLFPPGSHRLLDNQRHVYSRHTAISDFQARALGLDYMEAVLRPGEALFIPIGWWHSVQALTEQPRVTLTPARYISMGLGGMQWNLPVYDEAPAQPDFDLGPDDLNVTYTSFMFPWDNHSWHGPFPA